MVACCGEFLNHFWKVANTRPAVEVNNKFFERKTESRRRVFEWRRGCRRVVARDRLSIVPVINE
jgi:hypothetical protein